jgi:predicted 3-demethylubiquinone-9 3-methyltransferase (glyoxalase superfamily)
VKVSTFLWFDGRAEEAAAHYTELFADSEILDTQRTATGRVSTVTFDLGGQRCIAYNGGPLDTLTGVISMYVECETQSEVDRIWAGLSDGGSEGPGGSLTDRFGVTWQVIPTALAELLDGADNRAAQRVLTAVHSMTKINIQELVDARGQ